MRYSCLKAALLSCAVLALLTPTAPLTAQPLHRVTDLGRLPGFTCMTYPLAVNNRGDDFASGTTSAWSGAVE